MSLRFPRWRRLRYSKIPVKLHAKRHRKHIFTQCFRLHLDEFQRFQRIWKRAQKGPRYLIHGHKIRNIKENTLLQLLLPRPKASLRRPLQRHAKLHPRTNNKRPKIRKINRHGPIRLSNLPRIHQSNQQLQHRPRRNDPRLPNRSALRSLWKEPINLMWYQDTRRHRRPYIQIFF